ncbi:uncharacterized protein F4807DRAFT_468880 [Annulohypoxylon truncatum]|uniref:uncharacterized protein n=1 Tax=Annulohypoxylon truncatum TaxID=327061 RepID=UPI0020084091|nr:uncharacterized protein F4807DRAFT_468880 [Annulohypoxylon truncatum]KAI1207979.1 hypothetical protein F4807DRAFT_468880 [Annulohypoxylon truncatum]
MSSTRENINFERKHKLLLALSPDQGRYETYWRRQRRKGTCSWVFSTTAYRSWQQKNSSCILWLNGSIGSGKTVTMANIVGDIHLKQPAIYFFCMPKDPDSLRAAKILGSIAHQFFSNIPIKNSFWNLLNPEAITTNTSTCDGIIDLLLQGMGPNEKHFIVLDGLEDCSDEEAEDITRSIQSLMESRRIMLCSASRPESNIQQKFASNIQEGNYISVTMSNEQRLGEIKDFINVEVDRRTQSRQLDRELVTLIKTQLIAGAQGMFLWVTLQLEAVLPSIFPTAVSPVDICRILNSLPKDLPEAFDQALSRIRDNRHGNNHFKIVAVADPPLTLDEFRVALTIVPGETIWSPRRLLPPTLAAVHLCGGNLMEVDEEDGRVNFVHHSALVHLLSTPTHPGTAPFHFSPEEAEIYMGSVCVTYLDYEIFDHRLVTGHKIQAGKIVDRLTDEFASTHHVPDLIKRHITRHRFKASPHDVDVLRVARDLLHSRFEDVELSKCLLPYASSHWLDHTRLFSEAMEKGVWACWKRLVSGQRGHAAPPWTLPDSHQTMIQWAAMNSHAVLFRYWLHTENVQAADLKRLMELTSVTPEVLSKIGPYGLDDILAQCIILRVVDWEVINYFLNVGASPTKAHHQTGHSPIQLLMSGHATPIWTIEMIEPMVWDFICHPAVVDSFRGQNLNSSLITAIGCEWDKVARQLIKLGTNILTESWTDSPLGAAVRIGNIALVEELIYHGADAFRSCFDGKPVIQIALEAERADLVEILVREPDVLDETRIYGLPLLHLAILQGNVHIVTSLLNAGANPEEKCYRLNRIYHAILSPQPAVTGVDKHATSMDYYLRQISTEFDFTQGKTPLILAIEARRSTIVEILLRSCTGTSRNEARATALRLFLSTKPKREHPTLVYGKAEEAAIITSLIKNIPGSNIRVREALEFEGVQLLHSLARWGHVNVNILLELGFEADILSNDGRTPLYDAIAAFRNHQNTVLLDRTAVPLLRAGANPNITVKGISAMELAVDCEGAEALNALLTYGADPATRSGSGSTLLHQAVKQGRMSTTETLLRYDTRDNDVGINEEDSEGRSPLQVAVRQGHTEIANLLLEHYAVLKPNFLQMAVEGVRLGTNDIRLVKILLNAGAKCVDESGESILALAFERALHVANMVTDPVNVKLRGLLRDMLRVCELLVDYGADPNVVVYHEPCLVHCLRHCWCGFTLKLLRKGANKELAREFRRRGDSLALYPHCRSPNTDVDFKWETWYIITVLLYTE